MNIINPKQHYVQYLLQRISPRSEQEMSKQGHKFTYIPYHIIAYHIIYFHSMDP